MSPGKTKLVSILAQNKAPRKAVRGAFWLVVITMQPNHQVFFYNFC